MPPYASLPGYRIRSTLQETSLTAMMRGTRLSDGLPVIIRRLKSAYPAKKELTRLKNEFELTRGLRHEAVLRPLELLAVENSLALVQEDVDAATLETLLASQRFSVVESLEIGEVLARHLVQLHAAEISHRNLNPANILVAHAGRQLWLLDFGLATSLAREHQEVANPEAIGADLRYIAPEQTGRMNCPVDYRCDLYSLGIVLYEMITGVLPFAEQDPLDLVYSHLARQPRPPRELTPELPQPLNDLILKLLAKDPEDRYQSAHGLAADLNRCRTLSKGTAAGSTSFVLGRDDTPGTLHFRQRLYGREEEIKCLLEAFTAARRGSRELMLVAGYSGVGKTALVREVYRPMTRAHGYFGQGKFDQLQKNIPFSALVIAFRNLVQHVLTESEARLAHWREKLSAALGGSGRLLTEVIPELEAIIGPQPEVESLPPAEALNRFHQLFLRFIHTFCSPQHPLVLFLDDLQWIDSASLRLLEVLLRDGQTTHLLVIGAYRNNEVDGTHPLLQALENLQREGLSLHRIDLAPLKKNDVGQLIGDALTEKGPVLTPLVELLMARTNGNPFFLLQFLHTLEKEKLLAFDRDAMRWHWDLSRIEAQGITDNVVEMMLKRLKKLPETTRETLMLAACVGNTFDLPTLATISGQTIHVVFQALFPALQDELIINTSGFELPEEDLLASRLVIVNFRFLHDRVQQAAYALSPVEQRQNLHLKIGRRLLAELPVQTSQQRLFAVAAHLNIGRALIDDPQELIRLADLNLDAARRAREATAFAAALAYMQAAMDRLPTDIWTTNYPLALELFRERAALEHLNGNFEISEAVIREASARASSPVDKAETLYMLIVQYTLGARYPEAIALAREALALVGIELPGEDYETARDRLMAEVDVRLAGRSVGALIELEPMQDPAKKAAMRILTAMGPPCYRSHQRLWSVIVALEMTLILEAGNVPAAAYTYTSYGGLLGFVRGEYDDCPAYAELAEAVAHKYHSSSDLSVAHLMIGASLDHWFRHLHHAEESYRKAYQVGVDSGNLQYSVYAFGHRMYCRFFRGMSIDEQLADLPDYLAFSRSRKNQWGIDLKLGILMVLNNLNGRTAGITEFSTSEETEATYLQRCEEQSNIQVLCIYHLLKAFALYQHGRYAEADAALSESEVRIISVAPQGLLPSAEAPFLRALIAAARHDPQDEPGKATVLARLGAVRDRLQVWTEHCPENFRHKLLLVEAEMAAIEDSPFAAAELYDQAAEEAGAQGFVQHQALAWERAGRLWHARGKQDFAAIYLSRARYAYERWGASRKVALLEMGFPELDAQSGAFADQGRGALSNLDLLTVIQASQAISEQFRQEDLFATLLEIAVKSSGAEKAFLVLPHAAELQVVATIDKARPGQVTVVSEPLAACRGLSGAVVHYAARTREAVVLDNAAEEPLFARDSYIRRARPLSVLCLPILHASKLCGVFYLENNLVAGAFNPHRIEVLRHLAAQAAISLENARLYSQLESRVEERTNELSTANRQLKTAHDELARSNADLEQFAYIASHDLQEPLRMVASYLQLLASRYRGQLDQDADDFIEFAVDGAQRMQRLIQDLLAYSRIERHGRPPEPVDCEIVCDGVLRDLSAMIEEHQARVERTALPAVLADESQLRHLLQNLIGNAVKFHGAEPPRVTISASAQNGEVRFCVQDNGIGIEPQYTEKIFLIFQRLHSRQDYPGTGIGLAICRRIVERLGGRIWLDSLPQKGSRFYFTLPAAR